MERERDLLRTRTQDSSWEVVEVTATTTPTLATTTTPTLATTTTLEVDADAPLYHGLITMAM